MWGGKAVHFIKPLILDVVLIKWDLVYSIGNASLLVLLIYLTTKNTCLQVYC